MAKVRPTYEELLEEVQSLRKRVHALEGEGEGDLTFQSLAETLPDMISRHDIDSTYLYVSPASLSLFGFKPEELVGKKAFDFVHPEDRSYVMESSQHALMTGETQIGDFRHRTKSGEYIWLDTRGQVILDEESNRPKAIICVARYADKRRRAEEVLQRNRANLLSLIENTEDLIWSVDRTYCLIVANSSFQQEIREVRGAPFAPGDYVLDPVFGREAVQEWRSYYDRVLMQGEKFHVEKYGERFFQTRCLDLSFHPVTGEEGGICGVNVIGRDIGVHKQAAEALRISEEKLKLAQKIGRIGNWSWNTISGEVEWSEHVYRLFQAPQQKPSFDLIRAFVHPDDVLRWEETVRQAVKKKAPFTLDYRAVRRDGKVIWVHNETETLLNSSGGFVGFQGTVQDITRHKDIEASLSRNQRQLRTMAWELVETEDRERRRIAVYLHDEIGQSLAAVRMKFGAWKACNPDAKSQDMLVNIEQMIDTVIDKMRLLTFEISPPILYELGLGPTLEWLGDHMCGEYALSFEFQDDGQCASIPETLASALYRIVRELIVNVTKHAQARHIRISLSRVHASVHILVEDDGVGMEAPSFSGEELQAAQKFGLFSIRENIDRLGGELEIDSQVGGGTRVRICAPFADSLSD